MAKRKTSAPVPAPELTPQTSPQSPVADNTFGGFLLHTAAMDKSKPDVATWRAMRNVPTLALARAIYTAPIRTADIVVEMEDDAPDGAEDLLRAQWERLDWQWLVDACYGIDYGYAPFELVWEQDGPRLLVAKAKPLKADWCKPLVDSTTGQYLGLRNEPPRGSMQRGKAVDLDAEYTLWWANEPEAGDWYGTPYMERARSSYDLWRDVRERHRKYLVKTAAPIPIVEYPEGRSVIGGTEVNNSDIAAELVKALGNCAGLSVPGIQQAWVRAMADSGMPPTSLQAWNVRLVESSGSHGAEFVEALRACEVGMLRAWLVPERAATEGEHGTKAESETHGRLVDVSAGMTLRAMLGALNRYVATRVLEVNYGPQHARAGHYVSDNPDPRATEVRDAIITALLGAPINLDMAQSLMDLPQMIEAIGLPRPVEPEPIDITPAAAVPEPEPEPPPVVEPEPPPVVEPEPAPEPPPEPAGEGAETDIQQTALNGAQVTALADLAAQVSNGQLPLATARAIAAAAFPAVPAEVLDGIFNPLQSFKPTPPEAAQ